jgi:peptidoglycan/xylan/chitin deacetylase (PgdA/CDA1 family)
MDQMYSHGWRGFVKDTVASAIWRAHAQPSQWPLVRRQGRVLVVGYHRVVEDYESAARTEMPALLTSRKMFERHLDTIGRDFQFVSLDEIGSRLRQGIAFDRPVAAITFDDGYRDVYENAFPILDRKGIPAAVFVVTDFVGRPSWHTHDRVYCLMAKAFTTWENPRRGLTCLLKDMGLRAAEILPPRRETRSACAAAAALLPRLSQAEAGQLIDGLHCRVGRDIGDAPLPLTWPMLADLQGRGITIGSHTKSHAWLARESAERVTDELDGSRHDLERHLGVPVTHFAYPGGQFTPPIVEGVARAGYRFAYTACCHADVRHPALTIQRLMLWEGASLDAHGRFSSTILNCQAHGLWPPALKCARVHST